MQDDKASGMKEKKQTNKREKEAQETRQEIENLKSSVSPERENTIYKGHELSVLQN